LVTMSEGESAVSRLRLRLLQATAGFVADSPEMSSNE